MRLGTFVLSLVLGLVLGAVPLVALLGGQAPQRMSGTITDSMCADANHAGMRMGPTDAECATACVDAHGATYVLYDDKVAYALSDQQLSEKFAGKRVTVTGTLDDKTQTIHVEGMVEATASDRAAPAGPQLFRSSTPPD